MDILRIYLGYNWFIPTNQCFFCEQQVMALGYVHVSKLSLSLLS